MPITQRMIHNSPAHLSSEFCDHSTAWRRRKTSHIGRWKVVGSECIEAKRMNINIRGPASILHLLAAPRSPNLDTLVNVSPGRKGRRIRGFAARSDANRTREDHCFPQPDYARPTSRQIFRSVAPSLIYIYIYTMIHVSGPRYSSGDNGAATDRGRRFRGEIAFHAVLVHPCRAGVDASAWNSSHFRWKYLRKHLAPSGSCRVFRTGDYREERFIAEERLGDWLS